MKIREVLTIRPNTTMQIYLYITHYSMSGLSISAIR